MSLRSSTDPAVEHHDMETDAVPYTALPLTSNVVDPDVLRTQRRSDRKLAQLLGITVAREDGLPSAVPGDDAEPLQQFGETDRGDENHSEQWRVPAAWSSSSPGADAEGQPLIHTLDDEVDVRGKGKMRQRLSGFIPFRRRKAEKSGPPTLFGRVMRPSLVAESATTPSTQNPFGDEHAIERGADADRGGGRDTTAQDERMETHDGPFPAPSTPSGQWVTFPSLAAQTVSAPTTPRRSPRRRTPGSAKSWLSEVSNTSGLSTASSLRRKNVRRRARLSVGHESQMRSMRKTVQVLGPEAAGAVAKGTEVSPNKLRYMDFGRQMRGYMRRHL